ncbi:hypothetical protein CVT26_016136 [Gymnopilus dilepis]|uniref:Integrase zinc-binding domain-containing protein n=1 Tax=Gymnopilus dilepis TaxID=231916 RepID=A0A409XYR6_9AGAR|nr:hypothetical protein CVT26_016136 [Gymnopilus dilepis]
MSPTRPSSGSRRNPSTGFKPYARASVSMAVSKSMPSGSSDKSSPTSRSSDSSPNHSFDSAAADFSRLERPGFPTYDQYKQVELSYLQSLTPRRQGKALISQAMFDRIWDVLHEPETPGETAQFRFWARKMFTVSKNHRVTIGPRAHEDDSPQEVLLHDGLLVAIQEQLYDLLCYCHGSTGHGGRDKTCALIRKHYTWVPKDLVSSFIKACPTCIMKKCGNVDSAAALRIAQATASAKPIRKSVSAPAHDGMPVLPAIPDIFQPSVFHPVSVLDSLSSHAHGSSSSTNILPWPPVGGPADGPVSQPALLADDPLEAAYREAILRARGVRTIPGLPTGSPPKGVHAQAMTREVSLYRGLPNGWQYKHEDYASAHAEFLKLRDLSVVEENANDATLGVDMRVRRPRVPSIVPLWAPDQFSPAQFENLDPAISAILDAQFDHPPLPALPHPADLGIENFDEFHRRQEIHGSRDAMQYLLMASEAQHREVMEEARLMGQIDPTLFPFCPVTDSNSQSANDKDHRSDNTDPSTNSPPYMHHRASTPPNSVSAPAAQPPSTSTKRGPVPPRLNLDFAAEKTFQALLAYRDSLGEGGLTPDSPLANMGDDSASRRWYPSNPSPASSESSCGSQVSAFPCGEDSNDGKESAQTTPASSAVTTPVEECGMSGAQGISGGGEGVAALMKSDFEDSKDKSLALKVEEQEVEAALSDGMQVVCAL